MYVIGIDVGGTNTDATLIFDSKVVAMAKTPTNHQDLFNSTKNALEKVLEHYEGDAPIKLHLSTTLSTNAIVEGTGMPTKVVAIPGPGVNLESLSFSFEISELSGYVDHRGREVAPLNSGEVESLKDKLSSEREQALAVVGKFSQRNPSQEKQLAEELYEWHKGIISCGHRLSGRANFPRRITTAYLNASVTKQQQEFATMWERLQKEISVPIEEILILKADGGTMSLNDSQERPIETILSGPAASIMGVQALSDCSDDNFVIVDIGGTTTDLAVVVDKQVLFEREGANISGYKTLVPALLTRSVGLGGDSTINMSNDGELIIGPQRAGTPACLGGNCLTPTDAAVALELTDYGSRTKAKQALMERAKEYGLKWDELAKEIVATFTRQLANAVENLYNELESVPLYTIWEIVKPPKIRPTTVVGLGAPAEVFIPSLANKLNLKWEILPYFGGANAIGAAAAQATIGITLHGDTELARVTIPEMGYEDTISKALFFDLEKARDLAILKTKQFAKEQGYPSQGEIYILEEESFRMVRGFHTVGQTHLVRTQLRPEAVKIEGTS